MPPKSTNTKTEEKNVKNTKTKKTEQPVPEVKEEKKVAKVKAPSKAPVKGKKPAADAVVEKPARQPRQIPTRETVEKEFDDLISFIEEEVTKLRDSAPVKSKGVKFLRTVNKRVKALKAHTLRVSKQKPVNKRNNTNSGFLKPVQISKDLSKFTGWNSDELKSRVEVTKFICNYIKEKDLQDPEDRRKIRVEDDPNLKKLLKFDGKDKKPLTYYSLQTYLKSHFLPMVPEDSVAVKA